MKFLLVLLLTILSMRSFALEQTKLCDDLASPLFLQNVVPNIQKYYGDLKRGEINQLRCKYPVFKKPESSLFDYELTYFDALIELQVENVNSYPNYATSLNNLLIFLIQNKGLTYQKENLFRLYKIKNLEDFKDIWQTATKSGLKLNESYSYYDVLHNKIEYIHGPVINALNAYADREIIQFLLDLPGFDPSHFDHEYGSLLNWFIKKGVGLNFALQIMENTKFNANAPGIISLGGKYYYTTFLGVLIYQFSLKSNPIRTLSDKWHDGKQATVHKEKEVDFLNLIYQLYNKFDSNPYIGPGPIPIPAVGTFAPHIESALSARQVFYSIFGNCTLADISAMETAELVKFQNGVPSGILKGMLCKKFNNYNIPIGYIDTKHKI